MPNDLFRECLFYLCFKEFTRRIFYCLFNAFFYDKETIEIDPAGRHGDGPQAVGQVRVSSGDDGAELRFAGFDGLIVTGAPIERRRVPEWLPLIRQVGQELSARLGYHPPGHHDATGKLVRQSSGTVP